MLYTIQDILKYVMLKYGIQWVYGSHWLP